MLRALIGHFLYDMRGCTLQLRSAILSRDKIAGHQSKASSTPATNVEATLSNAAKLNVASTLLLVWTGLNVLPSL